MYLHGNSGLLLLYTQDLFGLYTFSVYVFSSLIAAPSIISGCKKYYCNDYDPLHTSIHYVKKKLFKKFENHLIRALTVQYR